MEILRLRNFVPEDAAQLQKILGDGETIACVESPYDAEKTVGFLQSFCIECRGYAYEACQALAEYAFEQLGAHKLFAETIDSVRSVGLMKKPDTKPEGVQRAQTRDDLGNWMDLYLYGLIKENFAYSAV